MIEIPEEKVLKNITDLLMNELPAVLLDLEEQTEDGILLPPFRYVGLEKKLPPGTGVPYAFLEIVEREYTEKDRIIKNTLYMVDIGVFLLDQGHLRRYFDAINRVFAQKSRYEYRTIPKKCLKKDVLQLKIVL